MSVVFQTEARLLADAAGLNSMVIAMQADVRQQDGRWLRFDDASVMTVSPQKVLDRSQEVYLLFYQLRV